MTNSINEAIAGRSAHDLASALADAGVSTTSGGNRNSDETCDIDGYGTVRFHDTPRVLFLEQWIQGDSGWQVRAYTDDCDYPISQTELANELAEVVAAVQRRQL